MKYSDRRKLISDVMWTMRKYDAHFAMRIVRNYFEQPKCKDEYFKLNSSLKNHEQILPPDILLNVVPEFRRIIELYAYIDMRNVLEMRGFLQYARGFKCLLDIGALYGDFSLVFCRMTNGTAHAVDPSPQAQEVLARMISINPDLTIQSHAIALGATSSEIEMAQEWIHCVNLDESNINTNATIRVTQKTIDEFVHDLNALPDVVKIDAEGIELDILKGGRQYFLNHMPRIFMEIHPTYLARKGQSVGELCDLLSDYGYTIYHSDGVRAHKPHRLFAEHEGYLVHRVICDRSKSRRLM
jgi:FkbM family methyltransferase